MSRFFITVEVEGLDAKELAHKLMDAVHDAQAEISHDCVTQIKLHEINTQQIDFDL